MTHIDSGGSHYPIRDRDAFYTDYEGDSPSMAIVRAIASLENEEPTRMEFTLNEWVNPDALDEMFGTGETLDESDGEPLITATFDVDRFDVTVRNDGLIALAPKDGMSSGRKTG